jgi:hypothetical protein
VFQDGTVEAADADRAPAATFETETGFTRAREGHALPRSGPPSIAWGALITRFLRSGSFEPFRGDRACALPPDPAPAATPVRSVSRRCFARRVGPPRGGSALRARPHLLAAVFAA